MILVEPAAKIGVLGSAIIYIDVKHEVSSSGSLKIKRKNKLIFLLI
jgi:hypothetical protein